MEATNNTWPNQMLLILRKKKRKRRQSWPTTRKNSKKKKIPDKTQIKTAKNNKEEAIYLNRKEKRQKQWGRKGIIDPPKQKVKQEPKMAFLYPYHELFTISAKRLTRKKML